MIAKDGTFWVISTLKRGLRHEKMNPKKANMHASTYLHLQVLPPLKDVKIRPEVGSTLRNKLVRLMTHVDMGVKQTAAEFLFVLCKESGERVTVPWVWHVGSCQFPRCFNCCLLMMSLCSRQPVEIHRVRKRRGTPGGPRTPGRRARRDSVL